MNKLFPTALLLLAGMARADDDVEQLGRRCADDFRQGAIDALWTRMTPDMQQALGSADAFAQFQQQTRAGLGEESTLLQETGERQQGYQVYRRVARYQRATAAIELVCAFDEADRIAGFFVKPAQAQAPAPSDFLDYQTRADLRLPFDGRWFVFWGGRTTEQNYHAVTRDQRFAYDFLVMRDGRSASGDGRRKEDYYCWDQPILAPAAGTVVAAVDALPDNEPGTMDPSHPAGNHVIIDLGHAEFALLAHLQRGSVTVKVGDRVDPGQQLGRCGNSGNTSEPHLHFHLQNADRFGAGDGLPAFFMNYRADGEPVARGEPVRGQSVEAVPVAN